LFCRSEGNSFSPFKVCCSNYSEPKRLYDLSPKPNVFAVDKPAIYNSDTSRSLSLRKFIHVL
jgi:hypothetical protein